MKLTLIKTETKPSRMGGIFYYAFFSDDSGKSFYSCLYPRMRNFKNWKKLINKHNVELKGLRLVKGKKNLVDADSPVKEIK